MYFMTLYLDEIDVKLQADMNNHIWWQTTKTTGHNSPVCTTKLKLYSNQNI